MSATFYLALDRSKAERLLRQFPTYPILRPCKYTARNPKILAVSYVMEGRICHSLVEHVGHGMYYGLTETSGGALLRTEDPYSIGELEKFLRNLC